MLGQFVNLLAIVAGGTIGTVFKDNIGERYTRGIMTVMGLITMVIGVQSSVGTSNILLMVLCLVIGTFIGIALRLDERISDSGEKLKNRLAGSKIAEGRFADAFVTSTVLFAVGTMAILGSIEAGLNHNYTILFTKSIMDFISAMAFAAALGPGVIFSAIPVFVFQSAITLLAGVVEPFLTEQVVREMSAVGGPIFIGMSINLLKLREERVQVGDMLPAIFLPIIYFNIAALF